MKVIMRFFIPVLLFLFSNLLYVLFLLSSNFTPRMYFYPQMVTSLPSAENVRRYSVYSHQDYLGIITLDQSLNVDVGSVSDILFRLKEEGQNEWIIENRYSSSDLSNAKEYFIGFPVQNSSEGKTYVFELEAVCAVDSACRLDATLSQVVLRHYFQKEFYIREPLKALSIITKKIYQNYILRPFIEKFFIHTFFVTLYFIFVWSKVDIVVRLKKTITIEAREALTKNHLVLLFLATIDILLQRTNLFCIIIICFMLYYYAKSSSFSRKSVALWSALLYLLSLLFTLITIEYFAVRVSLWAAIFFAIVIFERLRACWMSPVDDSLGK